MDGIDMAAKEANKIMFFVGIAGDLAERVKSYFEQTPEEQQDLDEKDKQEDEMLKIAGEIIKLKGVEWL